jgi:hypothetical protein
MILRLIILLLLLFIPVSGSLEVWAGMTSKFTPRVVLKEEYTNNLDLSPKDEKEAFITTLQPGILYSNRSNNYQIDLNYALNAVFYDNNNDLSYIGHDASLNTEYFITKRLNLLFKDYYIRSDNPRERQYFTLDEENKFVSAVKTERAVYWRNVASPRVEYRFGIKNSLGLTYRNNLYRTESKTGEDSREDYYEPFLSYSFNPQNEIGLTCGYTRGEFHQSPDLKGYRISPVYTRHINSKVSVFGGYTYLKRDYESPSTDDYDVNNPSLGMSIAISPSLNASASLGYFWMDAKSGFTKKGVSYSADLASSHPRITYQLMLNGGYGEDLFTSENLGFNRYNSLVFSLNYRSSKKMTIGCRGSVGRETYDFPEHKDTTWEIGGLASYRLMRWMTMSLSVTHLDRQSDEDTYEYVEDSGILKVTVEYD